jgi:hypothetical protein
MEPAPARPPLEAIDHDDWLVREWRVARLTGNGLNAAGGVWHEITTSGTAAPAGNSPPGGGGYGY